MSQKITKSLKEQAGRLKKAVERLLRVPARKTPRLAWLPVRNHNRVPY